MSRPSPESIKRAKEHLVRLIQTRRLEVVFEILDAGFEVGCPVIQSTHTTLLHLAVLNKELVLV